MIYFFTGQPGSGKTVLGTMLVDFLKTEKRNWRKSVFHVDGDTLREIFPNKDYSKEGRYRNIRNAQSLIKYLHINECDVVVSMVAPYKELREELKAELNGDMIEIYVHCTDIRGREHYHAEDYEAPTENFIDVDTTKRSPDNTFMNLLKEFRLKNLI